MPDASGPEQMHEAIRAFKREFIYRTLLRYDGNRSYAAAALGIDRTSLLRLLRELGAEGAPAGHNGRPQTSRTLRARPKTS